MGLDSFSYPLCGQPRHLSLAGEPIVPSNAYSRVLNSSTPQCAIKSSTFAREARIKEREKLNVLKAREAGFSVFINGPHVPKDLVSRIAKHSSTCKRRSHSVWSINHFEMKCNDGFRIQVQPPMVFEDPTGTSEDSIDGNLSGPRSQGPFHVYMSEKLKEARVSRRLGQLNNTETIC